MTGVRDLLIAGGHVRKPDVAGGATPCYIEPEKGAVAPGQRGGVETEDDLVVSMFVGGAIAGQRHERFMRQDSIDFHLRARRGPIALAFEPALKTELHDRRAYDAGGVTIIESLEWRPIARLGSDDGVFTYLVSYVFQTYSGDPPNG